MSRGCRWSHHLQLPLHNTKWALQTSPDLAFLGPNNQFRVKVLTMAFRLPELGSTCLHFRLPLTRFFPALLLPEVVFSTCALCLPQGLCTCSPFCPECASPSYSPGPLPRLLYLGHLRREAIPDPLLSVPSHHFIILYKPFT